MPPYFSVKEAVFPFIKFPGVDTILGPEMKSTGEVMGVGDTFAEAFVKSQLAAGVKLPAAGNVFISVKNGDKPRAIEVATILVGLGFTLVATRGTAAALAAAGVPVTPVNKVAEGRPHIVDMMKNDEIALVVNTVEEKRSAIQDSYADPARGAHRPDSRRTRRSPARAPRRSASPACASSFRTRSRRCTSGSPDGGTAPNFRSTAGRRRRAASGRFIQDDDDEQESR